MKITSTAFKNNEQIPQEYTCDGDDINPPLKFEDVPNEAASLALIISDPDAVPKKPFYHWVLFNMDPGTDHIDEDSVPATAIEGKNDSDKLEYGGPCPPSGTHRYIFKLYALDSILDLEEGAVAQEVKQEMEGHIVETAEVIGLYSKTKA